MQLVCTLAYDRKAQTIGDPILIILNGTTHKLISPNGL